MMRQKPTYQNIRTGEVVGPEDPSRGVWYAVRDCTYWTDRWTELKTQPPGIPCCPICGMVGMQIDWETWISRAKLYEANGAPGYVEFLMKHKETCFAGTWMEEYQEWRKDRSS